MRENNLHTTFRFHCGALREHRCIGQQPSPDNSAKPMEDMLQRANDDIKTEGIRGNTTPYTGEPLHDFVLEKLEDGEIDKGDIDALRDNVIFALNDEIGDPNNDCADFTIEDFQKLINEFPTDEDSLLDLWKNAGLITIKEIREADSSARAEEQKKGDENKKNTPDPKETQPPLTQKAIWKKIAIGLMNSGSTSVQQKIATLESRMAKGGLSPAKLRGLDASIRRYAVQYGNCTPEELEKAAPKNDAELMEFVRYANSEITTERQARRDADTLDIDRPHYDRETGILTNAVWNSDLNNGAGGWKVINKIHVHSARAQLNEEVAAAKASRKAERKALYTKTREYDRVGNSSNPEVAKSRIQYRRMMREFAEEGSLPGQKISPAEALHRYDLRDVSHDPGTDSYDRTGKTDAWIRGEYTAQMQPDGTIMPEWTGGKGKRQSRYHTKLGDGMYTEEYLAGVDKAQRRSGSLDKDAVLDAYVQLITHPQYENSDPHDVQGKGNRLLAQQMYEALHDSKAGYKEYADLLAQFDQVNRTLAMRQNFAPIVSPDIEPTGVPSVSLNLYNERTGTNFGMNYNVAILIKTEDKDKKGNAIYKTGVVLSPMNPDFGSNLDESQWLKDHHIVLSVQNQLETVHTATIRHPVRNMKIFNLNFDTAFRIVDSSSNKWDLEKADAFTQISTEQQLEKHTSKKLKSIIDAIPQHYQGIATVSATGNSPLFEAKLNSDTGTIDPETQLAIWRYAPKVNDGFTKIGDATVYKPKRIPAVQNNGLAILEPIDGKKLSLEVGDQIGMYLPQADGGG